MKGILKIVIYYVNYVIFRHPTGLTNKRRHLISDIKNKSTTKNYPLFKEMQLHKCLAFFLLGVSGKKKFGIMKKLSWKTV